MNAVHMSAPCDGECAPLPDHTASRRRRGTARGATALKGAALARSGPMAIVPCRAWAVFSACSTSTGTARKWVGTALARLRPDNGPFNNITYINLQTLIPFHSLSLFLPASRRPHPLFTPLLRSRRKPAAIAPSLLPPRLTHPSALAIGGRHRQLAIHRAVHGCHAAPLLLPRPPGVAAPGARHGAAAAGSWAWRRRTWHPCMPSTAEMCLVLGTTALRGTARLALVPCSASAAYVVPCRHARLAMYTWSYWSSNVLSEFPASRVYSDLQRQAAMNPDTKLVLEEISKLSKRFADQDAKWEARWAEGDDRWERKLSDLSIPHDARVAALERTATSFDDWRPVIETSVDKMRLEERSVMEHAPPILEKLPSAAWRPSSAGGADSPHGHHIDPAPRESDFGRVTAVVHSPVKG
nr:unnamed protein product [Digitaria exilis]